MDNGNTSSKNTGETPVVQITPEGLVAQIRALRAQIPDYTQTPAHAVAALTRIGSIDSHFINAATSAIGTSTDLQTTLGATPQQCVDEITEANRWAQAEDEIAALHNGIRLANLTRKHRIGLRALRAYQMTKQLVRVQEHDDLKPHLAEMRRFNRFGKGRRNAGPQPSPAPAPQQVITHDA
jgi:hypothetical protein